MTPLCVRPSAVVQRGAMALVADGGCSRSGAVDVLTAQVELAEPARPVTPPQPLLWSWLPPLPREPSSCDGKRCVGAAPERLDVVDAKPVVHTAINSKSSEELKSSTIMSVGGAGATVAELRPGISARISARSAILS